MSKLLDALQTQLDQLGLDARIEPGPRVGNEVHTGTAHLRRGTSEQTYDLAYGDRVPLIAAARANPDGPTLVFATHIRPKTADAYRRTNIQYVDAAGNAWIHFGDVLIDVKGRSQPHSRNTRVSGSLFTARRSQVIFALLTWPQLWEAPQRELARAAGVSLGQANNALALLNEAGFGPEHENRGQPGLLDPWTLAFPSGLAQRLTLARFRGEIDDLKPVGDETLYLSGEVAAAELLRPSTMTLYVHDLNPRLAVANRWRADGKPNITVRLAFWREPTNDDHRARGKAVAPWPLVYADLRSSDDPRVRNVASEWREQHA